MKLTKSAKITVAVALVFGAVLWTYVASQQTAEPLSLRFYAYVGEDRLELNKLQYQNPGGAGLFKIRDFQFYISNIRLSGPNSEFVLADSYHLLRFDGELPYAEIKLPAIDVEKFNQIHWGIGVDPDANGTVKIAGDLDPNNRMAWNWHVGYKFILFEGRIEDADEFVPLVYHVGFDENYTEQSLPLLIKQDVDPGKTAAFKVDINALFTANSPLDMTVTPSVKFDPDDAARIAAGFKGLVANQVPMEK